MRPFLVSLLLFGAVGLPAQQALTAAQTASACQAILAEARRSGLVVGFSAVDVATGEAIASSEADRMLVPASNMKIFTAGAALLGLGPDHSIYTDLIAQGHIAAGTLSAGLRLRGEGDPTLRSEVVLPMMIAKVKEAGIKNIEGGIVIDDRLFDRELRGKNWPQGPSTAAYLAEVSALSLNHGTVEVVVSAGPAGPIVELQPAGETVKLTSRLAATDNAKTHLVSVTRPEAENDLTVNGKVAVGTTAQRYTVAIHDAGMVFGGALASELRRAGIELKGPLRRATADETLPPGNVLLRLETKLRDVLPVLMKNSQNHRAEMLFKHLGAALADGGSFEGGTKALKSVFGAQGLDLKSAEIEDGSGLSRQNKVTASQIVKSLRILWGSPHRSLFDESFPTGGERDSTLNGRLKDVGKRLRAKTGTLKNVSALSGYVETQDGSVIAFAILTSLEKPAKLGMRDVQDRLVRTLARLKGGT